MLRRSLSTPSLPSVGTLDLLLLPFLFLFRFLLLFFSLPHSLAYSDGESVRANFGKKPFVFDFEARTSFLLPSPRPSLASSYPPTLPPFLAASMKIEKLKIVDVPGIADIFRSPSSPLMFAIDGGKELLVLCTGCPVFTINLGRFLFSSHPLVPSTSFFLLFPPLSPSTSFS